MNGGGGGETATTNYYISLKVYIALTKSVNLLINKHLHEFSTHDNRIAIHRDFRDP